MGGVACQTFWTAIAAYALTHGVADLVGWIFSTAYSGAAVLVSVVYGSGQHRAPDPTGRRQGCKSCGKWVQRA